MNLRVFLIDFRDQITYYLLLGLKLKGCKTVLDVGCGTHSPIAKIKKTFYAEGVDIFGPSLKTAKASKIHDKYVQGNILEIDKIYRNKKFDGVILLDVIEHLKKKDGFEMLKKMESIAKKKVIVVTPSGFLPQEAFDNNPYQKHISGWTVSDFNKKGYTCFGIKGLISLRQEKSVNIRYKPAVFWGFIALLSEVVAYFSPKKAFMLMAVKEV